MSAGAMSLFALTETEALALAGEAAHPVSPIVWI